MGDAIFVKVATIILDKLKHNYNGKRQLDRAMDDIRFALTVDSLNTSRASNINFEIPSLRCAYLFRHFTCIAISTRRMWNRFYFAQSEILCWCDAIVEKRAVNVCSIGGGPATDLLGFYMFLRMNYSLSKVHFEGVILEKYVHWRDMFIPLAQLFSTNVSSVKYKFFDFFQKADLNVLNAVKNADVVSIVKFVSAVGFDRISCQRRIEVLLSFVRYGVPVFFLDNSGGGYLRLMEMAARNAKLRLIAKIEHKKMKMPIGEKVAMDRWDGYFALNPQKNPSVSAAVFIR